MVESEMTEEGDCTARDRIVSRFCSGVTLAVWLGVAAATLASELYLLRTSEISYPYPMCIYNIVATPGTATVTNTPGAAGADFSQVFTSALALRHGESAYMPTTDQYKDHWGRLPNYPPLMNWLVVPLTHLRYVDALLLHTLLNISIFAGATLFVLWKAKLTRHIRPILLLQASLYFMTPIGITHLERGQFDLIVATASVLSASMIFLTNNTTGMVIVTGLLGALKWTSVPFLGCISALGFFLGTRKQRWAFFLIPVVIMACTLPFWQGLREYWVSIQYFEVNALPFGLTFQHLFPRNWVRAAPILLTLSVTGMIVYRFRTPAERALAFTRVSAPFSMALMNLAVCFGTLSYEYHTVTTLALIPILVLWVDRTRGITPSMKAMTSIAFGIFLVIVFRTFGIGTYLMPEDITLVYAVFAVIFFGVSLSVVDISHAPVVTHS